MIKKAEDTEIDTAEQSAIKLRAQQQAQTSNALVVTDQPMANGTPPVNELGLVKMPSMSSTVVCTSLHHPLFYKFLLYHYKGMIELCIF